MSIAHGDAHDHRFELLLPFRVAGDQVFAAMSEQSGAGRLVTPGGFTNTFNFCEFKPDSLGGRFVMHGPDGKNYPSGKVRLRVMAEAVQPTAVAVQHVSEPGHRHDAAGQ